MKGMYELGREVDGLTERLEAAISGRQEDARALHGLKTRLEAAEDGVQWLKDGRVIAVRAADDLEHRHEALAEAVAERLAKLEKATPAEPEEAADCPWCGSRSRVRGPSPRFWVECVESSCDASGPSQPSRLGAIAAWNKVAAK